MDSSKGNPHGEERKPKQPIIKLWDYHHDYREKYIDYHVNSLNTKLFAPSQMYRGISQPIYKRYSNSPNIKVSNDYNVDSEFENTMMQRRSDTTWENKTLIDNDLLSSFCRLVFFGNALGKRNYPSGGQMYHVNVYFVFNPMHSNILVDGHLNVGYLDFLSEEIIFINKISWEKVIDSYYPVLPVEKASMCIILSVNLYEIDKKYKDLSYKLVQQEVGHIGQNIQLAAGYYGIGSVPLQGYYDIKLSRLISDDEMVLSTYLLG